MNHVLIECEFDKGINGILDTTINAMHTNKLAKVVALEGLGHVANLDNPEVFNN